MRPLLIIAFVLFTTTGCGDDGTTPPDDAATWQLLKENHPSSLLAVWSSGVDNVWIVGGREGIGMGPTVFHFDGTAWNKLDTGLTNVDLWQVFGFAGGPVFMGGSNGTMLKYENGSFTPIPTPAADITFGIWGSSPDDVWAVGGQTTGRAFVWRYQGTQFEVVPGVPDELLTSGTVWKVVGRSANDIYMSTSRGSILHWDGAALTSEAIGATGESLFSIGCRAELCVTAGTNTANGVLYENDGTGWTSKVPTQNGPVWRGVTPVGDHTYVVGAIGAVIQYTADGWVSDPHGLTTETFHAAWADADGNLFAVGGKFDRAPTTDGVVLFKGTSEIPALP